MALLSEFLDLSNVIEPCHGATSFYTAESCSDIFDDDVSDVEREKPHYQSSDNPDEIFEGENFMASGPTSDRFLRACVGDQEEADRRWNETLLWRKENNIDGIIREPQPNYAVIKRYYSHVFLGRCRRGGIVWLERPGFSQVEKIYNAGVTLDELSRHYVFVTEFLWRVIDPDDNRMIISLFDCANVSMSFLSGKTKDLFTTTSKIIQAHFPERSYKLIVVNAPWWFKTVYAMVSPLLHPRTRDKMIINTGPAHEVLQEYIPLESLPVEYGGTDPNPLGSSTAEQLMWAHVQKVNRLNGIDNTRDPEGQPFDPAVPPCGVSDK